MLYNHLDIYYSAKLIRKRTSMRLQDRFLNAYIFIFSYSTFIKIKLHNDIDAALQFRKKLKIKRQI